jgi:RNA polymerase sigma-70 factor (ECF subfamily)
VERYDLLLVAGPSPVIALNRAIAAGFRDGYEVGLGELAQLAEGGDLDGYPQLAAARGDFLRRLGRHAEARTAYQAALRLTPPDAPDHGPLARRLAELP